MFWSSFILFYCYKTDGHKDILISNFFFKHNLGQTIEMPEVDKAWMEVAVDVGVEDGEWEINKNYNYLLYTQNYVLLPTMIIIMRTEMGWEQEARRSCEHCSMATTCYNRAGSWSNKVCRRFQPASAKRELVHYGRTLRH